MTSLLAMSLKSMPATDDKTKAIKFGASDENALMERYFKPIGTPQEKPFYIPFGDQNSPAARLRDTKYAGRTLQKLRTKDWGALFLHPDTDHFAFRPDIATLLSEQPKLLENGKVPLAALAVWLKRTDDVTSVKSAVDDVVATFHLDQNGLDRIFVADDIGDYRTEDLFATPMTDQEIAGSLELAAPPPIPSFTQADLEKKISQELTRANLRIDSSLVSGILCAWLAHDIAVLVGSPGTGKSTIAREFINAFEKQFDKAFVERVDMIIDTDFDLSRFVGYANLDGRHVPTTFTSRLLMDETKAFFSCLVLLDEWNLSSVDEYMAPVLAAIENATPVPLPGKIDGFEDSDRPLPIDTFILATCNSYLEEPETRKPLSRPVKRRCTIFEVPNWLSIDAKKDGVRSAAEKIGNMLLEKEREIVKKRINTGAATAVDHLRSSALSRFAKYADIDEGLRNRIAGLLSLFLSHKSGQRFVTIGVFKDVLLNTLFAPAGSEEIILAQQVAGKLLHLYQGTPESLADLPDAFADGEARAIVGRAIEAYAYAAALAGGEPTPLV